MLRNTVPVPWIRIWIRIQLIGSESLLFFIIPYIFSWIRSPVELVEEVILVDDASEQSHLGKELEDYVSRLPLPVHVLRTGVRSGLIRARLLGAKAAKAGGRGCQGLTK